MNKIRVVVVIDNYTYNNYIFSFFNNYIFSNFSLTILNIGIEECDKCSSRDLNYYSQRIYVPPIYRPNDVKEATKVELNTYGNRIIDLLEIENILDLKEQTIFLLTNYQQYYLLNLIKVRTNSKIAIYVDTLAWEHSRSIEKYEKYYTIFNNIIISNHIKSRNITNQMKNIKERFMFTNSDLILCSTYENQCFLNTVYNMPFDKLKVWQYGINLPLYKKDKIYIDSIKKKTLFNPKDIVILIYLHKYQIIEFVTFLKAISPLFKEIQELKLIVMGEYNVNQIIEQRVGYSLNRISFIKELNTAQLRNYLVISNLVIFLPNRQIKNNFCLNTLLMDKPLIITEYAIPLEIKRKFSKQILEISFRGMNNFNSGLSRKLIEAIRWGLSYKNSDIKFDSILNEYFFSKKKANIEKIFQDLIKL